MDKMTIATRLAVAFAAMVLLLMALGATSLVRSADQRSELSDVIDTRVPITKALGVLANSVNTQAIQFRNLVLFNSEPIARSAHEQIASSRATTADQYKLLDTLISSPKGEELLATMLKARADFYRHGDEFLALVQKGQKDEATKLLEEKLRPIQLDYQKALRDQVEFQAHLTDEAGKEAEAAAAALLRDVLIAGALAIALAIFLAITIIRSITRPLAQAVQAADRVAAGDLSGDIVVQSRDETGHLLSALQRMQQSLVATVTTVRGNAE
ncbi:HAMP domain-containing protein, partial [Acidovorax sp. CF316]|uniref:MCP four helix bundle domain-containing protein n=1 Tax=Acidovorax sp. CF316 TaxID=1144317 RepID=UPI00026BCF04